MSEGLTYNEILTGKEGEQTYRDETPKMSETVKSWAKELDEVIKRNKYEI